MTENSVVEARTLSTDEFPERLRLDAWREFMGRLFGSVDVKAVEDRPFRANTTCFDLPEVALIFGTRSDSDARSSQSWTRLREGAEGVSLRVVRCGSVHIVQQGREASVSPNGGVVYSSPVLIGSRNNEDMAEILLALEPVRRLIPEFDARFPLSIPAENGALRQLALYLSVVQSGPWTLGGALAQSVSDHLFDLAILTLGARGDAREAALGRGGKAARSCQILREIDARVADLRMSLATIAERLGLPESDVRAIFDETGEVFEERLEARRLDLAMQRLRSPDWDHLPIEEIARLSGFPDASRFRRRFRARFGDTPGAARARPLN